MRPSISGVKMYVLAQYNVFPRERGGHPAFPLPLPLLARVGVGGGMQAEGWTWAWGVGGFDLGAANREAYGRLVHGIASRPKPPPAPKHQGAPTAHSSSTPTTRGMPSGSHSGRSSQPWTCKGQYACCLLALI